MLIFTAGGERKIVVTWLSTSQLYVMSCSHLFDCVSMSVALASDEST